MDEYKDSDSMAVITSLGIEYKNQTYSCHLAIAQQWFSTDSPYHLMTIPVSNTEKTESITLLLDNGDALSTYRLSNLATIPDIDLDNYFQKLNQLKSEFRSSRLLNKRRSRLY